MSAEAVQGSHHQVALQSLLEKQPAPNSTFVANLCASAAAELDQVHMPEPLPRLLAGQQVFAMRPIQLLSWAASTSDVVADVRALVMEPLLQEWTAATLLARARTPHLDLLIAGTSVSLALMDEPLKSWLAQDQKHRASPRTGMLTLNVALQNLTAVWQHGPAAP